MASGILLDTSFFITLADPKRANHQTGRRYWKFFLEQQIPIYLSAIVVSPRFRFVTRYLPASVQPLFLQLAPQRSRKHLTP